MVDISRQGGSILHISPLVASANGLRAASITGTALIFSPLRTFVYVDGYNFYYASCKDTPHRWINPKVMAEAALGSGFTVLRVKYFSAAIKSKAWDPSKLNRQKTYWRALSTVPEIEIIHGHYQETKRKMFRVGP